jgi:putative hydrolase of HD superfamily
MISLLNSGENSMTTANNEQMLEFLTMAGNIKTVFRHSWLVIPPPKDYSTNHTKSHAEKLLAYRRESTADHSWRITLMALLWADLLDTQIDKSKAMRIALVHDLGEAIAGDIPIHQQSVAAKAKHQNAELMAMETMISILTPNKDDNEIYQLWREYEDQITPESKFVKAIDKLEAFLQHNEDALETWEPREMRMLFQKKWLKPFCQYDSFLNSMCETVLARGITKLVNGGIDIAQTKKEAIEEESRWEAEKLKIGL